MLWLNYPRKGYKMPGPHPDMANDWNQKPYIWFKEDDENKPSWWRPEPDEYELKYQKVFGS